MKVNVILVLDQGIITNLNVVKATATSEATFDSIAEKLLGSKEYEELIENVHDYDQIYDLVNNELEGQGKEIHWFSDIKVNKFK
jgi:hypothetical protein